ncbi:MAG: EamA family transporter [Actinomycetes bacterium]
MTASSAQRPAAVWFALVTVYLVWGSTYLAIRVIVESTPPLLAMGVRFVTAAALLAGFLAVRHGVAVLRVDRRQLASAGLVGALLLLCGNGGVALAERTVPSGLAALLVAATPLWLVCLRTAAGDRPRGRSLAGTGLGFVGIVVLAHPGGESGVHGWGLLMLLGATLCWAVGSFCSSRVPLPGNPFVATAYEMLLGGVALLALGLVTGELDGFSRSAIPAKAWAWLAYLVVFGSLAAFTAYVWLLQNAPISLTATYAYVNPVVAVALGALVLAEPITVPIVLGGVVVVTGVGLVVSTERLRRRQQPQHEDAHAPAHPPGAEPVEADAFRARSVPG